MTDAEKNRKDLTNAVTEFMVNPNSRNQMVLERAMRMYQTTTTAVEYGTPFGAYRTSNPT